MKASDVVPRLHEAGLLEAEALLEPLGGGVSSYVWRVDGRYRRDTTDRGAGDLVIKSPRQELDVAWTWTADVSRCRAEYEALRTMHQLTPAHVPQVVGFLDGEEPLLVMTAAPSSWSTWKTDLLALDPSAPPRWDHHEDVARGLGQVLAVWHSRTTDPQSLPAPLTTGTRLRDLRTDPFHRAAAAEVPPWAAALDDLADELLATRSCLVHGDVTPKNILVAADPVGRVPFWVLDAEVAQLGPPVLDLAMPTAQLVLKAVRRPSLGPGFARAASSFLDAYGGAAPAGIPARLAQHVGGILAGRVAGKSRVDYLDAAQQHDVHRIVDQLLAGAALDEVWPTAEALAAWP